MLKSIKSLAAALLCAAMLAACAAPAPTSSQPPQDASSENQTPQLSPEDVLQVQNFPCSTTDEFTALFHQIEAEQPDQIYFHPYSGLFQEELEVEGQKRILYTYIPQQTPNCTSSLFVALPAGEKAEEFLVSSGWKTLADENKLLLHAFVPQGEQWGSQEQELAYFKDAYTLGTKTINYSPYTGNYYFVGYGEGGKLLQQYIMSAPDNCSGLAVLDGSAIDAAYLETMKNTPAVDTSKSVSQVNVPVWIISKELTDQDNGVIDYWKSANQCGSTAYINQDVKEQTLVYQQQMLSENAYINSYPLGKVQITQAQVSYSDQAISRTIWESFLCQAQRYRSLAGNDLRPAMDLQSLGFTRQDRQVDGYARYWIEYVPKSVQNNPDQAAPLVIALHGAGQIGDVYAPYSEWHKVAEENGLIVVYPTAYPYAENNGMARPIHNDCWSETRPSDLSYWRQIIADVSGRFNVDASRVYATGHSNGGNSSAMIAGELSDVVAAVAISAGRYRNDGVQVTEDLNTLHKMESKNMVPVIQLVGTNDAGAYQSPSLYSTMMYWLQRNGCVALDHPLTYQTGIYHNQIWTDKNGIPMVRFSVVEEKPHTTTPSESRLFWYEFLSHYARGEDGSVLYMKDDTIIRN